MNTEIRRLDALIISNLLSSKYKNITPIDIIVIKLINLLIKIVKIKMK